MFLNCFGEIHQIILQLSNMLQVIITMFIRYKVNYCHLSTYLFGINISEISRHICSNSKVFIMKFFFQNSDLTTLNLKKLIQLGTQIDEEGQLSNIKRRINRFEKRVLKGKIKLFLSIVYFFSLSYSLFLLLS